MRSSSIGSRSCYRRRLQCEVSEMGLAILDARGSVLASFLASLGLLVGNVGHIRFGGSNTPRLLRCTHSSS